MLAKPNPSRIRRVAGATAAVAASALVGLAAWAAQPDAQSAEQAPRLVQQLERQAPQAQRPVQRLQPEAQAQEQAPRPVQRLAQSEQATPQPAPQPGEQPAQAGQGESGEAVPVVRVPPAYPPEALAGELTGRCILTFDLTEDGATRNVTAECSDAMFAAPATAAVERWRYQAGPARSGVQTVIAFELAAEETPEPAE
jgi:protein TonB